MTKANQALDPNSSENRWGFWEITATVLLGLVTLVVQFFMFDRQGKIQESQNELAVQQAELSHQVDVADRYNKASAQLASDKSLERIAGMYGLRDLAEDEQEMQPRALRLMASYLVAYNDNMGAHERGVAGGTLAVLSQSKNLNADDDGDPLAYDLANVRLSWHHLSGLRADGGYFVKANFEGANLSGAHLTCTDLSDANLKSANLSNAKLDKVLVNDGTNFSDVSGADAQTFQQLYWDHPPVGVVEEAAGSAKKFHDAC